ncbi:isocitrate lyase/phosphoenolpyruvate mutase family protein [Solirubrobacter sp. CPCC 204708]|uniref:Isocitrate lyase/phosphoenolpyruvate mutase family protein n=1 Tax=Solirubrobacter deserti TaxID=2282478 RepID=A0ABT4RMJ1_9ACTN|nr:isocitrate lyase/phosphoenolpyruvate mutase family protein [Solirubrobacter deserti]MBE2318021.1 isocitrate lyase/phosphoenolpyruvate mutase family protein [Solirubrobacter deserti]MDA0139700.1 isocitrate lyase/phosphoenolpyruvate mutase family protein [Solirubrobacter deserti]
MTSFKDLHVPGNPLILPNAWDFASAAALVAAEFGAIGTTSLGVAAAAGKRDGASSAWEETRALAFRLSRLSAHITVDLEHGFSDDPAAVAEHAAQLDGIAGVNLEDRHGDREHHARVIAAVKGRNPHLFVNARTDTHWLREGQLEDALDRCAAYVEAGADGVFVPGLPLGDVSTLTAEIDAPVNVLFQPQQTIHELAARGVARISTGSLLFRAALQTAVAAAAAIRAGDDLARAELPSYAAVDQLADL